MKVLIEAQLPKRLALWLAAQGDDAKHTLDLSIVLYNGELPWTAQPDIVDLGKPVPAGLMAGTARPTSND